MNNIAKLIYDSYKGNIPEKYAHVSKEARERAIKDEFFSVLGIENYESRTQFRRAWKKHKEEVYEIIEDVAIQTLLNGDYQKNLFFNQFVEIKNNVLGDKNEFYVEGVNQLEFVEFSGNHFDVRRQRVDVGSSFTTEIRDYGIKIYEYFERVVSGRSDFASIVIGITDALERKLSDIAYATFSISISNLPASFKVTGSYSNDDILIMLSHVQASNGVKPVLVGTSTALAKLQGKATIPVSDNMADKKNTLGYLDVWNGYTCMEISQGHKIGTFDFTMDNNKVYALTGDDKLVKLYLEGDVEVKEVNDGTTNADRSIEQDIIFKAGCAVAYNKMIGYIEVA